MGDKDSNVCKNPHRYEGKTVMVEGENQLVPMFSEWKYVCRCCCNKCNLIYFPEIKRYFCNQWECNPTYPFFVVFFLTAAFVFSILACFEFLDNVEKIVMVTLTSVLYLLWVISYFCAVCSSPGFLPFYWAVEKKEVFTFEQQMDGVVTTQAQHEFAAYNERPERGSFSTQARRLVLKADHICKWIANWVGLKNYRYFYLKVVWAMLYFIDWFVVFILVCIKFKTRWAVKAGGIGMLICVLPMFGFFGFIFIIFKRHTIYTCHNTSTLQQFKVKKLKDKHNYYDLGCWKNFVQIFGPARCFICWFFPVRIRRPWGGFHWELNRERPQEDSDDSNENEEENDNDSDNNNRNDNEDENYADDNNNESELNTADIEGVQRNDSSQNKTKESKERKGGKSLNDQRDESSDESELESAEENYIDP